jgi:valyl-tRNA synthetase
MQGLIAAIREVRAQHQVPPKRRVKLHATVDWARELVRYEGLVESLAGLSGGSTSPPPGPSAAFTYDSAEFRLSELADAVDAGAERARLTRACEELTKSITTLESRLANPGYAQRAPAHLVEQTRQQIITLQSELAAAQAALDAIS